MHVDRGMLYVVTPFNKDVNKGVMSQLHDVTVTRFVLQQYESLRVVLTPRFPFMQSMCFISLTSFTTVTHR
jgi:hypothetical protein